MSGDGGATHHSGWCSQLWKEKEKPPVMSTGRKEFSETEAGRMEDLWSLSKGILRASFEAPGESHLKLWSPYLTSPVVWPGLTSQMI